MQLIGDWADTSGDHLACIGGGSAEARFTTWWYDKEAQGLIRLLIDAERTAPGSLSFVGELDAIRQDYVDDLPWGGEYECEAEMYCGGLEEITPSAADINDSPAAYLLGDAA